MGVCGEQQQGRGGLQEGCYERCVQLTVAGSVHAVPLATGVVNARGIPTYLRQFLFMADPPSPQGKRERSFSLIGIELLFPFINNAGNPNWTLLQRPVIATTMFRHAAIHTAGKVRREPRGVYFIVARTMWLALPKSGRSNVITCIVKYRVICPCVILARAHVNVNGTEDNIYGVRDNKTLHKSRSFSRFYQVRIIYVRELSAIVRASYPV